jgi:hypothetical protein
MKKKLLLVEKCDMTKESAEQKRSRRHSISETLMRFVTIFLLYPPGQAVKPSSLFCIYTHTCVHKSPIWVEMPNDCSEKREEKGTWKQDNESKAIEKSVIDCVMVWGVQQQQPIILSLAFI